MVKFHDLKISLLDWNDKINVISRKNTDKFEIEHLLHALSIGKFVQFVPNTKVLDFGTGGGFPGIPLAILFPEVQFTLVDSISKKIKVVQGIVDDLQLRNVKAIVGRVEDMPDRYDFVTCRAVGRLSKIMPWVVNKIEKKSKNALPNGFIFLKGGNLEEEIKEVGFPFKRTLISTYFHHPFFETKEIVYLSAQLNKNQ